MKSRRGLLASVGTVGTIAIAGCSGGGSERSTGEHDDTTRSEDPATGNATGQGDDGEEPTTRGEDTEHGADQPGKDGASGPEAAARQFANALVDGDYDAANAVLHPESLGYPIDETDISVTRMELEGVEAVTYDEASERVALAPEAELRETMRERVESNNWTLVHFSFSEADTVLPVVETDGGWLVLRVQ
jgi:hypothetical protein